MKTFLVSLSAFCLGAAALLALLSFYGLEPSERCTKILAQTRQTDAETIARLQVMYDKVLTQNAKLRAVQAVERKAASALDLEVEKIKLVAERLAPVEQAVKAQGATQPHTWIDVPYWKEKMAQVIVRGR